MRILLAEDEKDMNRVITRRLTWEGYSVDSCFDGEEALDYLSCAEYDAVVLDVMMPRMDGFELTRRLRAEGNELPILMVTAREAMEDKWKGFTNGVDDYMVKPVDERELLLRIAAILRRSQIASERRLTLGSLTLSYDTLSAQWGEEAVELTKKEFLLLFKLLSTPGKIYTKRQLMQEIWEGSADSDEHTIEVHIGRLRDRFKGCDAFEIVTMRGLGYKAVKKD